MSLRKDGGMFILVHVDLGADESLETRKLVRFCTAEINLNSEDFVSPCSDPADKQVAGEEMQRNHEPRRGHAHSERGRRGTEEEMDCEVEDETVQDAERVRTISNSPARKNVMSTSNTCAVQKLVRCMCERTWNRDEVPQEPWCRK